METLISHKLVLAAEKELKKLGFIPKPPRKAMGKAKQRLYVTPNVLPSHQFINFPQTTTDYSKIGFSK